VEADQKLSPENALTIQVKVRLPVEFQSPNDSTGSGALAYVVLVPVLTVALYAIVGGALFAILKPLEIDEQLLGQALAVILIPLGFVVVTGFAFVDYRRRAGARIELHKDCVVVASAFHEQLFRTSDIVKLRIVPERSNEACQIELTDGRRIHVLSEVATFAQLRPALEASLIPELADRMQTKLLNGGTASVSESKVRAIFRIVAGVIGLGVGLLFFYLVPLLPWIPGVKTGIRRIRRGWRGMSSGFSLTFHSVTPTKFWGSLPIDRSKVVDVVEDDIGLVVHFEGGQTVRASLFAAQYCVVSHWLSRSMNLENH